MKKLKQYIFKLRAKKHLAQDTREKKFVNYNKANSVVILFESDERENNPFIKRIIEQLKGEGKMVSAWGFVNKKEISSPILPEYRILNKKSCDWSERPVEDFLRELTDYHYDLLIDLTISDILSLKYVLLYANAAFKAGLLKNEDNLTDFKIQIPEKDLNINSKLNSENSIEMEENLLIDDHFIFNQVIFYLKTIQTND